MGNHCFFRYPYYMFFEYIFIITVWETSVFFRAFIQVDWLLEPTGSFFSENPIFKTFIFNCNEFIKKVRSLIWQELEIGLTNFTLVSDGGVLES